MRPETRIHLHDLTIQPKGAEYVVAYEPAHAYITTDKAGLAVIKDLKQHSIGTTQRKHPKTDVHAIIAQLTENGLVHKIGHRVLTAPKIQDILDLPVATVRWTHHPFTRGTAYAFTLIAFVLLVTQSRLLPTTDWFFATPWLSILIPGAFILGYGLHFLHELGHYAVMRATGHPTGFHLVHRWHLLVPQADLTHIHTITPAQQLRVYLAGFTVDLTVFLTATIFILFGVAPAFWQLIAFLVWITMLVQLLPLAYTDATKVAAHLTKRSDVLTKAHQSIKSLCLFCKQHTTEKIHAQLLPWALSGLFLGLTIILVYIAPLVYEVFSTAAQNLLKAAATAQTPQLIDSTVALLLFSVFTSLYSVSIIREHHLGIRNWFTWLALLFFITANFLVVVLFGVLLTLYANPIIAVLGFIILGTVFGSLFLSLMEHVHIETTGFARDTFLPIYAASTGILLVLFLAAIPVQSTETIFGIAYVVGMLGSLMS